MDKVKLEFKTPKSKIIEYNNAEVEVIPFLILGEQVFLINKYIETYFNSQDRLVDKSKYGYIEAESNLVNFIFQLKTNIDVDTIDSEVYSDSVFINKVLSTIVNFEDFRYRLDRIIKEIKEQEILDNSAGKIFAGFIEKANSFLGSIENISPEALEKARETGLELMKKLEESSILGNSSMVPLAEEPLKKTRKRH